MAYAELCGAIYVLGAAFMFTLLLVLCAFEVIPGLSLALLLYMPVAFVNGGRGVALTAILLTIIFVTPLLFSIIVAASYTIDVPPSWKVSDSGRAGTHSLEGSQQVQNGDRPA